MILHHAVLNDLCWFSFTRQETHPEYADYIFLVAPVVLCGLVPLGIVLMEIQKGAKEKASSSSSSSSTSSKLASTVWSIIKGAFGNPLVLVTLIGLLGNLIFTAAGQVHYGSKQPDDLA